MILPLAKTSSSALASVKLPKIECTMAVVSLKATEYKCIFACYWFSNMSGLVKLNCLFDSFFFTDLRRVFDYRRDYFGVLFYFVVLSIFDMQLWIFLSRL